MTGTAQSANQSAKDVARSRPVKFGARMGILADGLTHLLIAWLALQIVFGARGGSADPTGAFQAIAQQPLGRVLLGALVVGFAGITLWRLEQAIWGFPYETDPARNRRRRVVSGGKVVVFAVLALLAARTTLGGGSGGGTQGVTAAVLGLPGGRFLVGAVGIGILVAGSAMVVSGVQKQFQQDLVLPPDRRARAVALRIGQVGFVAKGVAIGLIGVLVVAAAVLSRPDEATGLDVALRTLASQPFGPYLLATVAIGLVAYGAFCFIDARYHRV